jgi:uncharacterized protein YbjT (DUF2867 family)
MSESKLIAVVGATGAQGGGLARAILDEKDGAYSVRALTRHPDGEKAQALRRAGADVVAADLDDVESLKAAFDGVHGAFCVTNFWEHFSPEKELAQGRALAEAARAAGVGHVVWSTLEDTRTWVPLEDDRMPTLMGTYKVPHFDAKGELDEVFLSATPATCLRTSFYWDNLIHFGMGPQPAGDGTLVFSLPMGDAKLPGIAAEDIGRCALGLFRDRDAWVGKHVAIAGEQLTGAEMAHALQEALGRPVRYQSVPFDTYRKLGFPGAEDLGNMFQFKHDFPEVFCGPRDPAVARALNPRLQTFATWLEGNASQIPLEAHSEA